MSYLKYPGLAESPPAPPVKSFCAKVEPFDSDLDRDGNGWKRQPTNVTSDSWASKSSAHNANARVFGNLFEEIGRRDSLSSASTAAFYHQSSATSTNDSQEHYTHDNSSAALFSEEFHGRYSNDSSLCAFSSDFRSLHPRTKSRFDEIVDDSQENSVPMSSAATELRESCVYGNNGGEGIQVGDRLAMLSAQPTEMAQPNYQPQRSHHQDVPKSDERLIMNRQFFRSPTPSSISVPKKRTFTEISGFDPPTDTAPTAAKVSRITLISYPAVPSAVLKNYTDDRRYTLCHLQQNERQNPLETEMQHSLTDLRQELAFVDSLDPSLSNCLTNSKRLLISESMKLEEWHNPDWVEVDHNRPIKLSKQILIPTFRYPTINFIGRIFGFRGSNLWRICRKYKCFIFILGANSTKDRQQEIELLQSGDYRYAHFASPLHIRIDVIAPTHLAHMRMAATLNFFHKLLNPNRDFDLDAELADGDLSENREKSKSKNEKMQRRAEEERRWETDFEETNNANGRTDGRPNYRSRGAKMQWANGTERRQDDNDTVASNVNFAALPQPPVTTPSNTSRGITAGRARGGGFVPRGMRPRGGSEMNS